MSWLKTLNLFNKAHLSQNAENPLKLGIKVFRGNSRAYRTNNEN